MSMLSPGVYPRTIDESFGTPALADSVGAIVLNSNKGPIEVTQVTSRSEFIRLYGEPTNDTPAKHNALRFLRDSSRLNVLRVTVDAVTAEVSVLDGVDGVETFVVRAANPGAWGNDVSVQFSEGTSDEDTFRISVYYKEDLVETFDVSKDDTKKDGFGASMYIEDRVNNQSQYIRVEDDASNENDPDLDETFDLEGGSDDTEAPGESEILEGWNYFENKDEVTANILINGGWAIPAIQNRMIEVAEGRRDAIAVLDIPEADASSVGDMVDYRQEDLNANTSWAALYGPWVKIYDEYNDREIYIPPSGDAASVYARTSRVAEAWNAPAGFRRGVLSVIDVQTDLSQGDRDTLYEANINPIVDFTGEGIVVWGQKTLQAQASSLDRVNVRRLVIQIENTLEQALRPFVFENNTAFVRENITSLVENFMEDIETRRGVTGFSVICDETNNTPQVIDSNQLVVDLFIKPSRTAEFIRLNTILSPSGVQFN